MSTIRVDWSTTNSSAKLIGRLFDIIVDQSSKIETHVKEANYWRESSKFEKKINFLSVFPGTIPGTKKLKVVGPNITI